MVLIIGSTGYLGRAITQQLLDVGVPVRAMARNIEKWKISPVQSGLN